MKSSSAFETATADSSAEITFRPEELFFSRTGPSGIIEYGNEVFQRVSIYSWDELLGKPHKIVRHPDMPRAVFWQLWHSIKQGSPIGAYVKNRAKDGRFYWVFAIVTPIPAGYLSVRLKPTSGLFRTVKQEYEALRAIERRDSLAPEASAGLLLQRLSQLGFRDYRSFMAVALGTELAERDAHMGKPRDRIMELFQQLQDTARSLGDQARVISGAYAASENVPFNFRILAGQLGDKGAPIAVISANYGVLADEMKRILRQFIESAEKVYSAISDGFFLASTARVQREMWQQFSTQRGDHDAARQDEMKLLENQQEDYTAKAVAGLRDISRTAGHFLHDCGSMSQLAAGLEVTRVLGKMECARQTLARERMEELLAKLDEFQRTAAAALRSIDHMNQNMRKGISALIAQSRTAA